MHALQNALALVADRSVDAQVALSEIVDALRGFEVLQNLPAVGLAGLWPGGCSSQQAGKVVHSRHDDHGAPTATRCRRRGVRAVIRACAVADGVAVWRTRLLSGGSVLQFGGVASAAVACMSPRGPGCCDFNDTERVANVLTSLPFAAVGVHALRRRRSSAGRAWGGSLLAVAAASAGFHASTGRWRELGRRLDYWAISLSSTVLSRALWPHLPPAVTASCVAATPFKPFAVSAGNALAMELRFLRASADRPELRGPQRLHSAACLAAMALFAVEDASVPHVPFVHASWHCLSALGTALINNVLHDGEESSSSSSRWRAVHTEAAGVGSGHPGSSSSSGADLRSRDSDMMTATMMTTTVSCTAGAQQPLSVPALALAPLLLDDAGGSSYSAQ